MPGNAMIEAGIAAVEVRAGRVADGRARLERLCARHPNAMNAGMNFARRLLESEILQADIEQINQLTRRNQLDDVIVVADRALARSLDTPAREFMKNVRERAGGYQQLQRAVKLANEGEVAGAKETISALLASEPEPALAAEAQRVLLNMAPRAEPALTPQ